MKERVFFVCCPCTVLECLKKFAEHHDLNHGACRNGDFKRRRKQQNDCENTRITVQPSNLQQNVSTPLKVGKLPQCLGVWLRMLSEEIQKMAGIHLKGDVWEFIECKEQTLETDLSKMTEVGSASLKNKKKRDQKKKKLELSKTIVNSNKVTFGTVEEILFSREISYDAIPHKGAYPLGLGDLESRGNIQPVDSYCAEQQQNLRDRSASFEISTPSSSSVDVHADSAVVTPDTVTETFESRQYDYKQGKRNRLFEPTSEEERLVILGSFISASGMKKSQIQVETDTGHVSTSTHGQSHPHPIADLNRDLRNIRANRDNSTGCTCKALKVDKLSVVKMKSELAAHGHLVGICGKDSIEKLSKTELTSTMKDMLKLCQLCTENNCECVQLGVPCSAEVCGCLKHGKKCANPEGMNIFNATVVKEYRRNILIDLAAKRSSSASPSRNVE